jgi:undecaprenyl-diphosphatase
MAGTVAAQAGLGREIRFAHLAAAVFLGLAFAINTQIAATQPYLAFDVPIERAIQSIPWGPLRAVFDAFSWLAGDRQFLAGLLIIGLVFLLRPRAAPLMVVGAFSGFWYQVLGTFIHRARPSPELVAASPQLGGYGYPSGHAVFFTSTCILLVLILGRRSLRGWKRPAAWAAALAVILVACLSRIYVGAHWPSDILGGLLLGLTWTFLALSVRRLSDPVLAK